MRNRTVCALLYGLALILPSGLVAPERADAHGALSTVHTCVFDRQMLWTRSGTCQPRARKYPAGVLGAVRRAIFDSSLTFDLPYAALLRIAACESGLNPHARNASYEGLFQFLPDTFRRAAAQMHRETGIKAHNVWSARDASYAAGYMFVTNAGGSWSCARRTG